MSILTATNLGISFGAFDLFLGINAKIALDSKIGLIGPNGIGKTSLLLILAGLNAPTHGQVHLARGRRIGYLRQESMDAFANPRNTVYGEMLSIFTSLQALQAELHALEGRMAAGDQNESLLQAYGDKLENFAVDGGYDYDQRIQQTLTGLGLGKETWEMPLEHLSGGQKTRALLARLLLEKPDLLMLDEPTNHLDIEAVQWLENTLQSWQGAVLIVSHDRYFLDNTVNTIWEMSPGALEAYSGNYSAYLLQRQERRDYYQRAFEEEKARLLHEVDFIQRNWVRASTHARALGLLRKVTREIALVENYGILALRNGMKWSESGIRADRPLDVVEAIRRVNALQPANSPHSRIKPRLVSAKNSGNIVLRIQDVKIGYPGNLLFSARDIELRRGQCAALIGPNGSGKTTFLKVLLGQLDPLAGQVGLGASLKIGYFAQAHEGLEGDHSILDELNRHKALPQGEARSYLARYLFRGDDVFKPLSALSGGERARLALAILALDGANFLVLDEPTNHLDIPSQEALQEVLEDFSGAILLVSHDRYLIDRLATHIWEIRSALSLSKGSARLHVFHGSYREYVLVAALQDSAPTPDRRGQPQPALLLQKQPRKAASYASRKQLEEIDRLEERIRQQEGIVRRMAKSLQTASQSRAFEQTNEISIQLARLQVELDGMLSEWEQLVVK